MLNVLHRFLILSLLLCVHLTAPMSAFADVQDMSSTAFSRQLTEWNRALDQADTELNNAREGVSQEEAGEFRQRLVDVREAARDWHVLAEDKKREQNKLLQALGPAPEEGEVEEATELARDRKRLKEEIREMERQIKQSDLVMERSDLLLKKISTVEITRMVSNLSEQGPLPLDPRVWVQAGSQFIVGYHKLFSEKRNEGYEPPLLVLIPVIGLGILFAIWAGKFLRSGRLRHYMPNPDLENPSYGRRMLASLVIALVRGVVPVLVFCVIVGVLYTYWLKHVLNPALIWPQSLVIGVIFYLISSSIIRAVFVPELPHWNLSGLSSSTSRKIGHRLYILTALIAVGIVFEGVLKDTGQAPEFASAYSLIKNGLIALMLLALSYKSLWHTNRDEALDEQVSATVSLWYWPYLRYATVAVALLALACSLMGYHNFASYLLPRIVMTGVLAALFASIRVVMREVLSFLLEREGSVSRSVRQTLDVDTNTGQRWTFWLMTIADTVLIIIGTYLMLVLWKLPHRDIADWISTWFNGVSVGSYTFSLADLFLALLILIAVLGLFRVFKSLLSNKLLPQTSLNIGVQTAISSGVGYIGVVIALLAAITTLGIDLSKLALIAGALSVGIGFGLQNVVNNFVSGLILLFERPLQIGDWVVVGNIEGKVKQINVRSTEIETFNRASVIIPNADLIQTAFTNWTHKSLLGRVEVPVGVSYDADVDQVEEILLSVARERTDILAWPEPYVYMLNFGESSLDFKLYAFIDNVEQRLRVSSALRKEILKRFREAGVEIPFPQRVVTVHKNRVLGPDDDADMSAAEAAAD